MHKNIEERRANGRERSKRFRENNPDKIRKKNRKYISENSEQVNARQREYRRKNIDKALECERSRRKQDGYSEKQKIWNENYVKNNFEKVKEQRKRYFQNNKDKINKYIKIRRETDSCFALMKTIRSRVGRAIEKDYKSGSTIDLLGCTVEQLKFWLEAQFKDGMTWKNRGRKGWHIDHIKPLSSFDLTNPEELKQACHYTNLQPLWWYENLSKGNKS